MTFFKRNNTCRDCGVGTVQTYELGTTRTYCTHPECVTQSYNITYIHKCSGSAWKMPTSGRRRR
jgi:hypothetical protein